MNCITLLLFIVVNIIFITNVKAGYSKSMSNLICNSLTNINSSFGISCK